MRQPLTTALVAALAIALLSTPAWAQSGTRGIVPAASNAIQALNQFPSASAVAPMASAPMLQVEPGMGMSSPAMSSQMMSSSVMSSPMVGSPMMTSPTMSYSGPVAGSYNPGPSSNSYGPVAVGPYPQGRACCNLTPTPQVVPTLQPVTSCCSQNGRLGVPPLLTPIRYDMPPVGRTVGRPLFGKWNGY